VIGELEFMYEYGEKNTWKVAGASVRGSDHDISGEPCQDAYAVRTLPSEILVAAVADGAGSARLSETGARIASDQAVSAVDSRMLGGGLPNTPEAWKELVSFTFDAARSALEDESRKLGVPIGDLATTLIVLIATPQSIAVGQVGDGAVVFGNESAEFSACSRPQKGEYLNETIFLTSENAMDSLQSFFLSGCVRQVAAFTDGLERLSLRMSDVAPHAPFFRALFGMMDATKDVTEAELELKRLLRSPRVMERTSDDLTLLLATLPEP